MWVRPENNISYIEPLYRLAVLLLIVPPYGLSKRYKVHIYKCCCVIQMLATVIFFILSVYGKVEDLYKKLDLTVAVIDVLYHGSLVLSLVITIGKAVFSNETTFRNFTQLFLSTDSFLENNEIIKEKNKRFRIEVISATVVASSLFVLDAVVWMKIVGFNTYCQFLQRELIHYCNILTVLLIYNYGVSLKQRFRQLHKSLENSLKILIVENEENCEYGFGDIENLKQIYTKEKQQERTTTWNRFMGLRKLFSNLNTLVDHFNRIFGWQIFFLYVVLFVGFIEVSNLSIIQLSEKRDMLKSGEVRYDLFVLNFIWFAGLLVSS